MEYAAAVCYRSVGGLTEYLLVRTRSGRWTFPKGKVEPGEELWAAAEREAYEEAGATGAASHESLGTYLHTKTELEDRDHELRVHAFLMEVKGTEIPEEQHRNPAWFSFKAAEEALAEGRSFKYAEEIRRVLHEAEGMIARLLKG